MAQIVNKNLVIILNELSLFLGISSTHQLNTSANTSLHLLKSFMT